MTRPCPDPDPTERWPTHSLPRHRDPAVAVLEECPTVDPALLLPHLTPGARARRLAAQPWLKDGAP